MSLATLDNCSPYCQSTVYTLVALCVARWRVVARRSDMGTVYDDDNLRCAEGRGFSGSDDISVFSHKCDKCLISAGLVTCGCN